MIERISLVVCAGLFLGACDQQYAGGSSDPMVPADIAASEDPTLIEAVPPAPPSLTRDEMTIWNSLTPDAKRQAAAYIANGGTLTQFVAI